jgi:hypothetical protein
MSDFPSARPVLDRVAGPQDLRALSDSELATLAQELRRETIEVVSQTGGHLGSSLGVVELTVAIHAVFNTPRDKLIWDVGHQCYPHKIIDRAARPDADPAPEGRPERASPSGRKATLTRSARRIRQRRFPPPWGSRSGANWGCRSATRWR